MYDDIYGEKFFGPSMYTFLKENMFWHIELRGVECGSWKNLSVTLLKGLRYQGTLYYKTMLE